jgi:N-methylhydantoinase A
VKHDYVRSKLVALEELDMNEINGLFTELIEQAKRDLRDEGFQEHEIKLDPFLDLRYAGQGYELTVPCPAPPFDKSVIDLIRTRFDTQHEQASGHKAETEPVELVSLRLISYGLVPQAKLSPAKVTGRTAAQAKTAERKVYVGQQHGVLDCQIYARELLEPGHKIIGPSIIEQLDTTTVIHPEQQATVDEYGNLMIAEYK